MAIPPRVSAASGSVTQPLVSSFVQGPSLQTVTALSVNLEDVFAEAQKEPQQNITVKEPNLADVLVEVKALKAQVETQVVTKADLANLRQDLLETTSELVTTKLAPLQKEVEFLKNRYTALETQNKALQRELEAAKQRGGLEETNWKEADRVDPANKHVAFLGWLAGVAAQRCYELCENWVKTALPNTKAFLFLKRVQGTLLQQNTWAGSVR